ncbi:BLOC-2 complex member HPS5-like [Watersipora subatra]|uniref:BLOC-2 complex member HPS5-like n=1 Tax=Watersipora subatra TaxID=2589382 RepID=UPI00355B37D4
MAGDEDQKQDDDEDIWILVELKSLEDLATPIKLSKTIQFTTIDVSKSYIWCGSNRSSLYVFDRQTLKHVYLITISPVMPDVEAVTQLAVCHTDQLCAAVNCYRCQVFTSSIHSGTTKKPEVVEALRTDTTVTQLVWHGSSAKLYIGDNAGSIHVCSILTNKMIPRSSLLCRLDSCIVQLDFKDHILLAATLTKCTTYHTERKTFTDIGKKARNGYYGAVILPSVETENSSAPELVCYCSRPGLRLWRADTHGKVLATLNFKQTLAQSLLSPVFSR